MMIAVSLCLSVFITIMSADRWPQSGCLPPSDNCDNYCRDQSTNGDVCTALDNEYCNFLGKRCKCHCISRISGDCSLDQIIKPKKSSCSSQVTNLDNIDNEIGKSMGFNIAFGVLGAVPKLGEVTDVMWAAWSNSVTGPITSQQQLANNLINDINEKFDHLKDCMDEKITNLKSSLYEGKVRNIATRYFQVRTASDDDKIRDLRNLFGDFNGYIADIFQDDTSSNTNYDYAQYESLLPVYTALVPIWAALTHDQLLVQKIQGDDANFNSDVITAINGFDTMKSWLLRARDNIENSLRPARGGLYQTDPKKYDVYGNPPFDDTDCCGCGSYVYGKQGSESLWTSEERNKWCHFSTVARTWDRDSYCNVVANFAISVRNSIVEELSEWMDAFNGQYLTKINLYIESLERIRDGDATSYNILKDNMLQIRNMKGKCLDIHRPDYDSNTNGGKVQIWECYGWDNQEWYYDMDTKQIKNMKDKCLDIHRPDYDSNTSGGKVQIWECGGWDNQKWDYNWGTLEIKNQKGKCLDLHKPDYDSNKNGGMVQIYDCLGWNNQKFNLYPDFIEN